MPIFVFLTGVLVGGSAFVFRKALARMNMWSISSKSGWTVDSVARFIGGVGIGIMVFGTLVAFLSAVN